MEIQNHTISQHLKCVGSEEQSPVPLSPHQDCLHNSDIYLQKIKGDIGDLQETYDK